MVEKWKVAVLFGGCSSEYDVSLRSACAVLDSLLERGEYDVLMVGITRQGTWRLYDGPLSRIADDTWMRHESCRPAVISPDRDTRGIVAMNGEGAVEMIRIDVAFPVLHGLNGEDGTVQGLLALADIPCVGCGLLSSAVCMDKDVAHRLVRAAGVRTPQSVVLAAGAGAGAGAADAEAAVDAAAAAAAGLAAATGHLRYPLFVKPANAGSSIGISRVEHSGGLAVAVATALEHDRKAVVEEEVPGFEVGCAILGCGDSLVVGGPDEIELAGGFFDYSEKYGMHSSRIHLPARVDAETAERIRRTAVTIYGALGCRGLARVDMFVTPDKQIVFNEVNTIPGFTPQSRYANMLRAAGVGFERMISELVRMAVMSR